MSIQCVCRLDITMAMREGFGPENTTRIRKNYELLITTLDLNEIIDPFISAGYFDLDIEETIKAETEHPTSKNKIKIFLKKLVKCSDSAYSLLRATISERGYHHIVEALDNTEIKSDNKFCQQQLKPIDRLKELGDLRELLLDDRNVMKFNLTMGKDMDILGQAMGFVDTEIDHIKMESQFSVVTQMHKLFTKWRHRNSRNATLGLLTETLQNAELYGATVQWDKYDKAIEELKKHLSKSK